MARLLGIDYGARRVGLALSDESATIAAPYRVLRNSAKLAEQIVALVRAEGVATVVLGESKNFQGQPNPIQAEVERLAAALRAAGLQVELEPEFLTSAQAARVGPPAELDARAAALILQTYLDRHARVA